MEPITWTLLLCANMGHATGCAVTRGMDGKWEQYTTYEECKAVANDWLESGIFSEADCFPYLEDD